jgi:uncharacterized protein (DUF2141 family)
MVKIMKKIFISILSLAFLFSIYSFVKVNPDTYSLCIEVNNLRNSKGIVQFALYNKEGSIPDEHYKNYYKLLKGEIVNHSSTITFKNLPKGKYAVNILHDENKNGKIEKGFIFPIEGIGFSNLKSIGLSNRPNFSKTSFELNEDKAIKVKVIYF